MAVPQTQNPLLARDDVGKAPPTCYDLPEDGFVFGRPDNPDFEGAREVTMQWVSHTPRPRRQEQVQDFRKLNKGYIKALQKKALTPRDVGSYRKTKDVPLTSRSDTGPAPKVIPSDVIPDFTYGKQTRASTPIGHVVSYKFATEYQEDLGGQYDSIRAEKEKSAEVRKIRLTTAAHGHASAAKKAGAVEESKDLFKLKKFKRVVCKVEFPGGKTSEMKKLSAEPPVTPPEIAQSP